MYMVDHLKDGFKWCDKTAVRPPVIGHHKLQIVRKREFVLKALPGEFSLASDEQQTESEIAT